MKTPAPVSLYLKILSSGSAGKGVEGRGEGGGGIFSAISLSLSFVYWGFLRRLLRPVQLLISVSQLLKLS